MGQETLTDRQQKVLEFLRDYIQGHGFPPTLREIGDAVGIGNLTAVRGHLSALEKKGRILKSPDKARSIQLLEKPRPEPSAFSRLKRVLHKVLRTDEGIAYRLVYGIAWATWEREDLLRGRVVAELEAALEKEAVERGWNLHEKHVQPNQVTVVVSAWPSHSPEKIVRRLQQATREVVALSLKLPGIPKVWSNRYAVTTELDSLEEMAAEVEGD
jgi:REP element-mobilizing transposase RayT